MQFHAGLRSEIAIEDGPPVHHARYMGAEIAVLQERLLRDLFPADPARRDITQSLASFTVFIFAPFWLQAFTVADSAPLLLSFIEKVRDFER